MPIGRPLWPPVGGDGRWLTFLVGSACVLLSRMRLIPVWFSHVLLCLAGVLIQGWFGSMKHRTVRIFPSALRNRSRPRRDLLHEIQRDVQSAHMVVLVQSVP